MAEDRRIKYTKMAIRQSFLELLGRADINKITVKEICGRADVNRGTFYAHYRDPYDLMESIESELFTQVEEALESGVGGSVTQSYEMICRICRCIAENADICTVILGEHGDADFLKKVLYIAYKACTERWKGKKTDADEVIVRYASSYAAMGSVGVLQEWLKGGMQEKPEKMAKLIDDMTRQGLEKYFN